MELTHGASGVAPPTPAMQMPRPGYWQEAVAQPSFRALLHAKSRTLVPMGVLFLVCFLGVTLLAGFAKNFMAQKVLGAFNMGYLLVLSCYLLCWALALIYVRIADRKFDALSAQAVAELVALRGQP